MKTMSAVNAFNEIQESADKIKDNKNRKFPEAASIGDSFRQGDIYITLVNDPNDSIKQKNPSNQIATGDTQGSRHCIDNLNNVDVYQKKNPGMLDGPVLLVKYPVIITHPEHGHVELPIGCYDITYQKNLDSEEREMRAID